MIEPRILGPYELQRVLGEGGMGTVYLGWHKLLEVHHAIKVLSKQVATDDSFVQRFFREAKTAANLDHPHIVKVFGADRAGGQNYMAMQYVKGSSLAEAVKRGALAPDGVVKYIYQIARALAYAHDLGMIHRDVKPGNILINPKDDALLTDFGLVRDAAMSDDNRLTLPGALVGTFHFMSPEQWQHQEADIRSDLYALGVTMYYALTRRFPYQGRTPSETLNKILEGTPFPISRLRPELDWELVGIVHHAVEPKADRRYQTAQALADALSNWWNAHSTETDPTLRTAAPGSGTHAAGGNSRKPSPPEKSGELRTASTRTLPDKGIPNLRRAGSVETSVDFSAPGAMPPPEEGIAPIPAETPTSATPRTGDASTYTGRRRIGESVTKPLPRVNDSGPVVDEVPGLRVGTGPMEPDWSLPIEIAPGTFWAGQRTGGILERNIYLRLFEGRGSRVGVVIDPGPPADLPTLRRKIDDVFGSVDGVNLIYLNHQDPDVAYNAAELQRLNPKSIVVCSQATWRLARLYGLDDARFRATEDFERGHTTLKTGHKLQFLPSPHCHFAGAVMLYDQSTGVLFTGDLFGGLSFQANLYADPRHWAGIQAFHQIYMPNQQAVRNAIHNILGLNPLPTMLAPQHGAIIRSEDIEDFLAQLADLEVGADLMAQRPELDLYIAAMNEIIAEVSRLVGVKGISALLERFNYKGEFPNVIQTGRDGVKDILIEPRAALEIFISELFGGIPTDRGGELQASIQDVLFRWNIPLPDALSLTSAGERGGQFLDLD